MDPKDQIKENLSIVDVVSTYVRLEKSGAQFRARCPFHNERTPSFYVSPERKSFHCFGCQAHGDIFTFVEKIENIPFFDALKILADRAGISLKDTERNKEESRLIALLKDATEHFERNLKNSPEARQYILERGLTEETLQTFHIGYAKNEWRDLFIFLASKGYQPEEMEAAGIMIKTEKGYYDRFRGRIMFPIRNVSGATVGYSGRILPSFVDPSVAQGKYVNTPETALYHKSKILFGYDTAKKEMSQSKSVVVVEGQMDLCMSYQAGVHNTVAVSGTAFTDEHIHLIKRFCDTVILSFDADQAGQSALKKTAQLCLLGGLDVYVIVDMGTKDPADLIREHPDTWRTCVEKRKHVVEVILERVLETEGDTRLQGRRIVAEVLPFIRFIQSPVDRAHFVKVVSDRSGIPQTTLLEELASKEILSSESVSAPTTPAIPPKERLTRELIAFATLYNKREEEDYRTLDLDVGQFPESIIQEEMFRLEEKLIGNTDAYFRDLVRSYKKELHKQELALLQEQVRSGQGDTEGLLKQIYELVKRASLS
ncbi:MAG: primase, primase protein [Candidatus Parcubacteria bacterium]|jgi:DNA primase